MSLSRIKTYDFIKKNYLNTNFYSTLCNKFSTSFSGHISLKEEIKYLNKGTWGYIFKIELKNKKFIKIKIQILPNTDFSNFKRLNDPRDIDTEKFTPLFF